MISLVDIQDRIVESVSTLLPQLKECAAHPGRFTADELKRFATKTPAAHIALPKVYAVGGSEGRAQMQLKFVTVLVAKNGKADGGKPLSGAAAALAMMGALCAALPTQKFGAGVLPATDIQADNLYNETARDGIAMWAVHWTNSFTYVPDLNNGALLEGLYYSIVPDVGPDHIDDYATVSAEPVL